MAERLGPAGAKIEQWRDAGFFTRFNTTRIWYPPASGDPITAAAIPGETRLSPSPIRDQLSILKEKPIAWRWNPDGIAHGAKKGFYSGLILDGLITLITRGEVFYALQSPGHENLEITAFTYLFALAIPTSLGAIGGIIGNDSKYVRPQRERNP